MVTFSIFLLPNRGADESIDNRDITMDEEILFYIYFWRRVFTTVRYCMNLSAAGPGKIILISYKREVSTKLGQKRKVVF